MKRFKCEMEFEVQTINEVLLDSNNWFRNLETIKGRTYLIKQYQ